MSVIIVIPARFASTRFPGKPLVSLKGADGTSKTLIERSWLAAMSVEGVDRVVVATDDDRIRKAAEGFGAEVIMTSSDCKNGTERCADAIKNLEQEYEIVVNLQGDAPLTPSWFVEELVAALDADPTRFVATPVLNTDVDALSNLLADRKAGRVGGTTAVFDNKMNALYFSKEVIPYVGDMDPSTEKTPVYHHVGVYAYRSAELEKYETSEIGPLEGLEGLEQLRFLENGLSIYCVEVNAEGREFWELNNPEDIPRIESMLMKMGMN
jgi:3-deoxy-manno-octulosonate cytidylyltransferase (CMP-KDO synthetase)